MRGGWTGAEVRVFIMDCGGVLGPPLIRWLLQHMDAAIVGSGSNHERLAALLEEPRFSFYTLDGQQEPALVSSLVEHADIVVDLSPVERPLNERLTATELQEELRVRTELVRLCSELGRRLVHVSSAEVYGNRWPTRVGSGPLTDADRQVREDEAPLVSGPVGDEELAASHERMTQHLIYTYGETESLDYTILRLFDVLGDRLEMLPRADPTWPVAQVRDAIVAREARTVRLQPEDLYVRTLVYVEDAAEAVGLAIRNDQSRASGEVLNVGEPANRVSRDDLARLVLERYREQFWDGRSPLPLIADSDVAVADRNLHLRLPSIEKAVRLLGWRPRWSLLAAVDAALETLLATMSSPNGSARG